MAFKFQPGNTRAAAWNGINASCSLPNARLLKSMFFRGEPWFSPGA